ncbi:MAG: hypothetical protein BWY64_01561 [bacterium ADurb.Bin363]|nr:MAG: hypothetical protein BWY64_01561 [bacterium ADurb.Bin363]
MRLETGRTPVFAPTIFMKKILILTEEFGNSISPVSFLNGYLSEYG